MIITGTIEHNGVESSFTIGTDGGWQQWGADQKRLGETVDAVETMARALMEEGLLEPEVPEPDDEEG